MLSQRRIRTVVLDSPQSSMADLVVALAEAPDLEVAVCSDSWQGGLPQPREVRPDVALVPLTGMEPWAMTWLETARRQAHGLEVVAVARDASRPMQFLALALGASALLRTDSSPTYAASVVRRVYQGERLLESGPLPLGRTAWLAEPPAFYGSPGVTGPAPSPLSPRELEVLRSVAQGKTNKQIAGELNLSEQTVKNHVTSILRKLGAQDRAHAVYVSMRQGWMDVI